MAGPLIVPPVLREPLASRILVVDDEPLIRWALCSALEAAGFDAVCAASSADARRAASDWPPPRVALVDLLSEQDARDLLADIRRIYPACRFVLMTTADREWPGMSDDDVEFLEKPFDLSRVVSLVSRMGAASPLPAGGA